MKFIDEKNQLYIMGADKTREEMVNYISVTVCYVRYFSNSIDNQYKSEIDNNFTHPHNP